LNEQHAANVQGWHVKRRYVGLGTAEGAKVEVCGHQAHAGKLNDVHADQFLEVREPELA